MTNFLQYLRAYQHSSLYIIASRFRPSTTADRLISIEKDSRVSPVFAFLVSVALRSDLAKTPATMHSPTLSKTGKYHRIIDGDRIEEFDVQAKYTKHFWTSHKKESVDLTEDSPFALERQLDDQRYSIKLNRNPQLFSPTKADKSRSQLMLTKSNQSRDIAIKAKVLNKIVREVSEQHTYTLVPPPSIHSEQNQQQDVIDPLTHPAFRAYALETKQKPVIRSFGHRPGSASRTFNPGTSVSSLLYQTTSSLNLTYLTESDPI